MLKKKQSLRSTSKRNNIMLRDNLLEDILNEYKNGDIIDETHEDNEKPLSSNPFIKLLDSLFWLSMIVLKIFIYGISINIIFKMDLSFYKYICLGLFMNFLLEYSKDITIKKK